MQFFLVYIREAHPADGWQMAVNEQQGIVYDTPTTLEERELIASECVVGLELSLPTLVDGIDNAVSPTRIPHVVYSMSSPPSGPRRESSA